MAGRYGISSRRRVGHAGGDNLTLSSITTTVHVGAHCDAPNHYAKDGVSIAERSLEPYYGPCQMISVKIGRGERVLPEHIQVPVGAERVLFKTMTFPIPIILMRILRVSRLNWSTISTSRGEAGGLDTPSVDLCNDKELLSHNAIAKCDMSILEGVV